MKTAKFSRNIFCSCIGFPSQEIVWLRLTDLFDYIFPAGLSCQIIKLVVVNSDTGTQLWTQDTFTLYRNSGNANYPAEYDSSHWSKLVQLTPSGNTDTAKNIASKRGSKG